jgi:hypothetical protein
VWHTALTGWEGNQAPPTGENKMSAETYTTICNLIEAIWLKRNDKDYYNIDTTNLPPLTSPQARKLATFIMHIIDADKQ